MADSVWTLCALSACMAREKRQPAAVMHDHGVQFYGQFERQLRVMEIDQRRTPVALPVINGCAERAVKSVRLELLNHVRVRGAEELQWYLDEYRRYFQTERANQALDGQTPAAFRRGEKLAEVIDLEAIRRRRLARRSYGHGLLNSCLGHRSCLPGDPSFDVPHQHLELLGPHLEADISKCL